MRWQLIEANFLHNWPSKRRKKWAWIFIAFYIIRGIMTRDSIEDINIRINFNFIRTLNFKINFSNIRGCEIHGKYLCETSTSSTCTLWEPLVYDRWISIVFNDLFLSHESSGNPASNPRRVYNDKIIATEVPLPFIVNFLHLIHVFLTCLENPSIIYIFTLSKKKYDAWRTNYTW